MCGEGGAVDGGVDNDGAPPTPTFPPSLASLARVLAHPHICQPAPPARPYLPPTHPPTHPGTNVILGRQQRLTEEYVPRADLVREGRMQ